MGYIGVATIILKLDLFFFSLETTSTPIAVKMRDVEKNLYLAYVCIPLL